MELMLIIIWYINKCHNTRANNHPKYTHIQEGDFAYRFRPILPLRNHTYLVCPPSTVSYYLIVSLLMLFFESISLFAWYSRIEVEIFLTVSSDCSLYTLFAMISSFSINSLILTKKMKNLRKNIYVIPQDIILTTPHIVNTRGGLR